MSKMAMKGVWEMVVALLMIASLYSSCSTWGVVQAQETWEEVLTRDGTPVLFGASNTYTIWSINIGIGYLYRFYFGLGYSGDTVRTDTTITMGAFGDESRIYACQNGTLQLVNVSSSGTPQEALIRLRRDSTSSGYTYLLQITEASPAVYAQFVYLSQGGLLCSSDLAGTPLRFQASSSASSSDQLHRPNRAEEVVPPQLLRQVVDSA